MDMKPAGQPEYRLASANSPKVVLSACLDDAGTQVSL